MPKERKSIEVKVKGPFNKGAIRLEIEEKYDKEFPEYKHAWYPTDRPLPKSGVDPVKVDGAPLENGRSMLCRFDRQSWDETNKEVAEASLRQLRSVRNDDTTPEFVNPLVRFANPKIK